MVAEDGNYTLQSKLDIVNSGSEGAAGKIYLARISSQYSNHARTQPFDFSQRHNLSRHNERQSIKRLC